jgi:hypothetical protein
MAKKIRDAAEDPRDIPELESIRHSIHRWETGKFGVSERYRLLYCRVFGRTEFELFGTEPPEIITEARSNITSQTGEIHASTVTADDGSGNQYVVLVLPKGSQRLVIDITSTDAEQALDAKSLPMPRLALVKHLAASPD